MRVRIAPDTPRGTLVQPVPVGQGRPGFMARPGEAAWWRDRWLVALGDDAEAAGALAAARMGDTCRAIVDLRGLAPGPAGAFILGLCLRAWRYDRLRTMEDTPRMAQLDVLCDAPAALRSTWRRHAATLEGVTFARDLVAEPSNTLTPSGFVDRLRPLARRGIGITVLARHDLRRAGLGGLLAVGGGSPHPPRLVVLQWPGTIAADPVVFVGKGITFDTGGLCSKPAKGMEAMRADMAGAAACAGAMLTLAARGCPAPAAAVLALAENVTGEGSYRPADVLRMGNGLRVEVVDTDAEGRLVLADALAWAVRRLRPVAIVDLATLTGSIVAALGGEMAGLFDNDASFATRISAAGRSVGELLWRMPIGASHRADLESDIADLRHCVPGRGQPDACHAAAFLRAFVGSTPWVHLDIAGTELRDTADDRHAAGPTGFGVRLLDRLVAQSFEDPHR